MNKFLFLFLTIAFFSCSKKGANQATAQPDTPMQTTSTASIFDFTMDNIDGTPVSLKDYEGKVILVVNTASKCGLTPQYEELQAFYEEYKDKGVVILGFPANNFLGQEPGTEEEIKSFCSKNYGVTFPMFSKISVKGKDQHPLYTYLTEMTGENVKWNFHKFLIGKDGKVIRSIDPRTSVKEEEVISAVQALL
jgi:glutathione peroxidase